MTSAGRGRSREALLSVDGLTVTLNPGASARTVVRDVSLEVSPSEIVGVVGESGSGKSMTALAIMGLLPDVPNRTSGRVWFAGRDLLTLDTKAMQRLRGSQISMIFQEPMTALDPVFTIGQQLEETIRAHQSVSRRQARLAAIDMLGAVGIPLPARRASEYPHQLSGGMRQRVMVAMALICQPKLLIADEPTTAVDVTIQAQILELVRDLSRDMGTAVVFITHDLGVVAELCERVVTLYCGEAVESGATAEVLRRPRHPYTSALMQAIPKIEDHTAPLRLIPGRVPAPDSLPGGCLFHPRCSHATDRCRTERQSLSALGSTSVRCWRSGELELLGGVN